MIRLKNEIQSLVNRGRDRHIRLAVTGLSRSGKTAFITAFVNQLLNVNSGARLPLFSVAREGRLHGVKRVPQKDFGIPRFTYDEGIASLYGDPPAWPTPTRGVSEIRLALRYQSNDSFLRHFTERASLYLEIIDYPGEWLLDLPMLEQDYQSWSQKMDAILKGQRREWAAEWLALVKECDPLAPADERLLAKISAAYTQYLTKCKDEGLHFIQPGRFVLPGELQGAPALQFFPWPQEEMLDSAAMAKADKKTNYGMLKARYDYYCQKIVKGFYKDYFVNFDRQIILVDCLQPLNSGLEAFTDMQTALNQLMQSFQYGQRTLLHRLFSPRIDKLMFAATKADHITPDQHANLVSLLQQLVKDAWQHVAFEGINVDCVGLASIQATESGIIEKDGQRIPTLKGFRLDNGEPLMVYPGAVPARLPSADFWLKQGFNFDEFRPLPMRPDVPLPHIRLDAVMEFLIGDKLK
jgi:predicted YcjX-like family ATPase